MLRSAVSRKPKVSSAMLLVATVATLYFAQEVLIPLALSVLLAFLLAPFATRLERLKFGRVPAVLIAVGAACVVILSLGWVVGSQVAHLAEELPRYQDEMVRKAMSLRGTGSGLGSKIEKLGNELEKATVQPTTQAATQPATGPATARSESPYGVRAVESGVVGNATRDLAENPVGVAAQAAVGGPLPTAAAPIGTTPAHPFYAVALPAPVSPIKTLATYLGLVLGPLSTVGLVVVFVVFILLERQDLRDRLIHLISRGKYTLTTRALNDAGSRISRYILAQACVNGSYGVVVALGLWIIGLTLGHGTTFPSFVLWGLICAVLRFVPYVGPGVAALFPLALSLAVYPGFNVFLATLGLVVLNELISNNVVEPGLYGASTGLSSVALLVAAVFWTWLWGPVGLLMATPLTVCIVVLGKYVPQLKFLDVLLGDQPALPPGASFYQRLVAGNTNEAVAVVRDVARTQGTAEIADTLLLPALRLTRRDREDGDLSAADETGVLDSVQAILRSDYPPADPAAAPASPADLPLVLGCPAHHLAEELTLQTLAVPEEAAKYRVEVASTRLLPAEIEERVRREDPGVIFIAVLPPGGIPQARHLCRRLRKAFPDKPLVVGFWGRVRDFDRLLVRFRAAGASYVTTSVLQSRKQIAALLPPPQATVAAGAAAAPRGGDDVVSTPIPGNPL